jgi:transposase InsO family protein
MIVFIQSNLAYYTISQLCSTLKFPRSTYYEALVRKSSKGQLEYEEFSKQVKAVFEESKQRYGAVKIQRALNQKGIACSLKRVQRHMIAEGLRSVVVKKYKPAANQGIVPDDKKNILNRDFVAETIHKKWVTDITYIHVLKEGWTYFASVMDLYSRKIVGYAYGTTMTAELAVQAVKNACLNVKETKGIILHSDLGSQYTSQVFEQYLSKKEMIHSFSRKGNPYDNACIESFHSVLKKEEIYLHTYHDFKEAQRAIFEYIEAWYNRKRIHSSIGYLTPQQKEDEELKRVA